MKWGPCPQCGGADLYRSIPIDSGGSRAPNLLPGLGKWFAFAKFHLVVCQSCGLTRFFADPEATEKLQSSPEWNRVA